MQIVKALVGGLAGGSIGVYVSNVLQQATHLASPWSLLLVGLGAGLGVRLLCGKNRNFATGAVSAIATIVALLGISYANSMAVLNSASDPLQPVVTDWEDLEDEAEEEAAADADEPTADDQLSEAAADESEDAADADQEDTDEADTDADEADDQLAEGSDDDEGAADDEQPAAPQQTLTIPKVDQNATPRQVDWRSLEVIMHGLSALLAYFLGMGTAVAASAVSTSPPAEPPAAEKTNE